MNITKFLLSFIFCFLTAVIIAAQPGSLDPTFGNNGKVASSDTTTSGGKNAVALQTDGKIVVAGTLGGKFAVFRFNTDGMPDTTFGTNGSVTTEFYLGYGSTASAVAIQPDGRIVAGGSTSKSGSSIFDGTDFAVARFLSNGSLDTSFGGGTGRLVTNIANDSVKDLVVQPDGKIVFTGDALERVASQYYIGRNIFAIRYNADGTPDTAFGNNGTATASYRIGSCPTFEPHNSEALALQPDGKIIVTGFVSFCDLSYPTIVRGGAAIVRFLPDGQLDNSFDSDGKVLNSDITMANAVTLQSDGKIIAVGQSGNPYGSPSVPYDFGIFRYTTMGALDASFDGDGKVVTSIEAWNDIPRDVLVQPNGKIVVAGESSVLVTGFTITNFAIARLNLDGSLDGSFDDDGKAITDFNNDSYDSISRIVLQPDGKILAVGATKFSTASLVPNVLAMARYIGDAPVARRPAFDYDGDGRADVSVFRPSDGVWYLLNSTSGFSARQFGQSGDRLAPADYDGDGRTDLAVFREPAPGAGDQAYFYIFNSADNSFRAVGFGTSDDVPLSGDWDGDGRADLAVYRQAPTAGGQSYFYYRPSSQPNVDYLTLPLGTQGDKAVLGDFDGDGRIDPALFRPTADASGAATWIIWRSSMNQITQTSFGLPTDVPTPADFDGDGATNIAVFRPSTGTWYTSTNPANYYGAIQFGASGDAPVAADYDGDGRADVAVFRPSSGAWYLNRTTSGFTGVAFGTTEDAPVPNAFVP